MDGYMSDASSLTRDLRKLWQTGDLEITSDIASDDEDANLTVVEANPVDVRKASTDKSPSLNEDNIAVSLELQPASVRLLACYMACDQEGPLPEGITQGLISDCKMNKIGLMKRHSRDSSGGATLYTWTTSSEESLEALLIKHFPGCSQHDISNQQSSSELCQILDTHFTPPKIIFNERKQFYLATSKPDESVAAWYARVKQLAMSCNFGAHLNAMALDKFVVGLQPRIFDKMCEEDETLTLEQALRKALIMESKIATKTVSSTDAAEGVNFMRRSKKGSTSSSQQQDSNSSKKKPCKHCGWRNHASTAYYCMPIEHTKTPFHTLIPSKEEWAIEPPGEPGALSFYTDGSKLNNQVT
ncbi:hypothetical protein ACLKA6_016278 [Drosophila palustris]